MRVDPAFLTRQDNLARHPARHPAAHFGKMPAANRSGTAMNGPDSLDSHPVPGHLRSCAGPTWDVGEISRNLDAMRGSGLAALKSAS